MDVFRGRLIDHIQLVVEDLDASRRFYKAVFDVFGVPMESNNQDSHFWGDELFVSKPDGPEAAGELTGRHHIAFQAKDRETVDRFYAEGLKAGGKDNGAPGERRKYHPGYYAAFLLDPDGNNIEAVHHGEAERSADAVKLTFDMPSI